MKWCMQCGALNRPEKAIGVDEDGEPACSMHCVKSNAVTVEPAAPSPLQATEREKADMAIERTYSRTCSCGCGGELKGRWPYLKGHNKSEGGALPKKPRGRVHVTAVNTALNEITIEPATQLNQANDPVVPVYLRASQVWKLLELMLR